MTLTRILTVRIRRIRDDATSTCYPPSSPASIRSLSVLHSTIMSTAYSGSLQIKKKAELQEIAQALAIPDAGTREDLQQRIKKHLEDYSTNLEGDPVFAGLYTTRRRQRSLQPSSGPQPQPTRVRTPEQPLPRYTTIVEERGFTPPADDMREASQMIPKSPMSPGLPTPSPPRHSSMSPRVTSSRASPTKSLVAEAMAQPEVQAALEMERDTIGWLSQTMSAMRTVNITLFPCLYSNTYALFSYSSYQAVKTYSLCLPSWISPQSYTTFTEMHSFQFRPSMSRRTLRSVLQH